MANNISNATHETMKIRYIYEIYSRKVIENTNLFGSHSSI